MFVLLYSVCRSVSVLSCVDVIQSFSFTCCYFRRHQRRGESVRESERQYQRPLAYTIRRREKNKTGISGCGSFVVPYFQPATSIDCLQVKVNQSGEDNGYSCAGRGIAPSSSSAFLFQGFSHK